MAQCAVTLWCVIVPIINFLLGLVIVVLSLITLTLVNHPWPRPWIVYQWRHLFRLRLYFVFTESLRIKASHIVGVRFFSDISFNFLIKVTRDSDPFQDLCSHHWVVGPRYIYIYICFFPELTTWSVLRFTYVFNLPLPFYWPRLLLKSP